MADDAELQNKIDQLMSSIDILNTSIRSMSSKMGTPEYTSDKLVGAASTYHMVLNGIGSFNTLALDNEIVYVQDAKDLIHITGDTYLIISAVLTGPGAGPYTGIYEVEADGSAASLWGEAGAEIDSMALMSGNSTYYLAALASSPSGVGMNWQAFLFDNNGNQVQEVNFDYTGRVPDAILYDSDNDRLLIFSDEANAIYELNISLGTLTKVWSVPFIYYTITSATYVSNLNLILITTLADEVPLQPNDHAWFIYDPSSQIFIASGFYEMIYKESEESYYATYNSVLDSMVLFSGVHEIGADNKFYLHHLGLSFAQLSNMVGPNVYGSVSVDDDDSSLTVDGSISVSSSALPSGAATSANQTPMITALQLIDDLQSALKSVNTDQLVVEQEPAPDVYTGVRAPTDTATLIAGARASRRGFIIQNVHESVTIWIGNLTVSSSNGIELLPKQTIALNNYTGASKQLYAIADTGLTGALRYMEIY